MHKEGIEIEKFMMKLTVNYKKISIEQLFLIITNLLTSKSISTIFPILSNKSIKSQHYTLKLKTLLSLMKKILENVLMFMVEFKSLEN
mgnify:CR=1 FL=1